MHRLPSPTFCLVNEPFDYTKWQRDVFKSMSVKKISEAAMEYRNGSYQAPE
jgi:hypothetical protein